MKSSYGKPLNRSSRRSVVKQTVAGVGGLAAVGGLVAGGIFLTENSQNTAAHASGYSDGSRGQQQAIQNILNIAATAETLAVVFYSLVLQHANQLNFKLTSLRDLQAALIEEQIHLVFLELHGARPLTKTFSFPFGEETFERLDLFLKTQQQLESAFVAAYLAAIKEFAQLGRPDLAQVAGQIGAIESEHRVVGRTIGAMFPINNEAFAPVLLNAVADAPTFLKNAGYLTPRYGNSFSYKEVSTSSSDVIMRTPSSKS